MIEILIIIAVVKAFCFVAEKKGQSKVVWGIVGAASYYVPILLMNFLMLPALAAADMLPFVTEDNAFLMGVLINLATGISCCYLAFILLKASPDKELP